MLSKARRKVHQCLENMFACLQPNVRIFEMCLFNDRLKLMVFLVYNWCEIKAKMWILNLGKPVNIPVLNEAMAIELGANLLGEGIIFIIAAGILIAEYNR